jgi:hypothetical protein
MRLHSFLTSASKGNKLQNKPGFFCKETENLTEEGGTFFSLPYQEARNFSKEDN